MTVLCGTIVIRCGVDHGSVPDEMRLGTPGCSTKQLWKCRARSEVRSVDRR